MHQTSLTGDYPCALTQMTWCICLSFWSFVQSSWPGMRQLSVTLPDQTPTVEAAAASTEASTSSSSEWLGQKLETTAVELSTPLALDDNVRLLGVPSTCLLSSYAATLCKIGYSWARLEGNKDAVNHFKMRFEVPLLHYRQWDLRSHPHRPRHCICHQSMWGMVMACTCKCFTYMLWCFWT